jgi:HD-GYP domain-containing protein (c-di-GMP phosphodiesterase class II)
VTVYQAHPRDDLVRRLAAALRGAQLYSPDHPLVKRNISALADTLAILHASAASVVIGIVGEELVVGDVPMPRASENLGELMRRLKDAGIERIGIDRGVPLDELTRFVQTVVRGIEPDRTLVELEHIHVGRLRSGHRSEIVGLGDHRALRHLYDETVSVAETLWDSAKVEGAPDPTIAGRMVESLADAITQNRPILMALTALRDYDNYTFTHMVNVSILTMGQARGLGIDGPLLHDLGLAGLMHDIGKVRTPLEVLNKPGKLDDKELEIMRRHPVDGAEILRVTPEIPSLAPVVAFEHHLRADGSGYPAGVKRHRLNLATELCGVADVYDALRSQRVYRGATPSDRVLALLKQNDGKQFDQNLVRRFVQLVGIYPVGNLVRLDTGEIGIVVAAYAPDPYRPRVRVVADRSGARIEQPYDVDLWNAAEDQPQAVQSPLNPAEHGIDPLSYLEEGVKVA